MPKKHIVTIIIIVLSVIMFMDFRLNGIDVFESYFQQMETDSIRNLRKDIGYDWRGSSDQEAEKTHQFTVDPLEATELFINNRLGSIKIKGEDRQNVSISYKLRVYADTSEQAEEFIQQLEVESKINGSRLEFTLARLKYPDYIVAVLLDYDMLVPRQLALDLTNRYGELQVSNMANDVDLAAFHGEMTIFNISGEANILSRYGTLYLASVEKPARVDVSYGKATIKNIRDNLTLKSNHTNVGLDTIKGSADIKLSHGALVFEEIAGNVKVDSGYAEINGKSIGGEFTGDLSHGELTLHDVQNNTNITSNYCDLNLYLSPLLKDFWVDCRVKYKNIRSNLPFKVVEVGNQKELKGESGTGEIIIDLEGKSANILLFQE